MFPPHRSASKQFKRRRQSQKPHSSLAVISYHIPLFKLLTSGPCLHCLRSLLLSPSRKYTLVPLPLHLTSPPSPHIAYSFLSCLNPFPLSHCSHSSPCHNFVSDLSLRPCRPKFQPYLYCILAWLDPADLSICEMHTTPLRTIVENL